MCVTGEISLIDDKGLFDEINFSGTERLRLEIAGLDRDAEPMFEKTFIMDELKRVKIKAKDNASVFFFFNRRTWYTCNYKKIKKFISRFYYQIIAKNCTRGYLNKNVDIS